jgi:hypothetical protein
MKNLLNNISQEEKERILEMHKKNITVISEQVTKLYPRPRFKDPESIKINNLFMSKFLPTLTPERENLTSQQYADELKKILLDETKLEPVISFFTQEGYKQPNKKIEKLQSEITNFTGVNTFTNKKSENNKFGDGVFGVATAQVLIQNFIQTLESAAKAQPDKKVGEIFAKTQKDINDPNNVVIYKPISKKEAGLNTKIDLETQKIK